MAFNLQMTQSWLGLSAIFVFIMAYILVITEELTELRKSKPVILAAGMIWVLVAMAAKAKGLSVEAENAIKHTLLEYVELFLFLLVAMTYVNAMEERRVFDALKGWLIQKQFSYRSLFWITGFLAFFISPIADNMTTALVMCAIIMAVGHDKPKFVAIACVNVVVAANAGGAFSPFGDITTLMVWQKGILPFQNFFQIFIPCLVNFVVPASLMHFAIPKETPFSTNKPEKIKTGGLVIVGLFLFTIAMTVTLLQYFHLPSAIGMMTGLALLQFFGYFLKKTNHIKFFNKTNNTDYFDIFSKIRRIEWDTLLFFYGVLVCISGLAAFGYLHLASTVMYEQWGSDLSPMFQHAPANILIGILSALIDNIPLMFAVLTIHPNMSEGQWLLVTLTTGVGGSLLSIGSAAGVALMGQAKGLYTFFSHLKWTWAIAIGYFASIAVHFILNRALF